MLLIKKNINYLRVFMELNWTIEVIVSMIAIIPMFASIILLLSVYKKNRNTFLFYYLLAWTTYILFWIFQFLAYLTLTRQLYHMSQFFMIPVFTFVVFAFDYMNEERLQPFTTIFITGINAINLYILLTSNVAGDYIYPNGDISFSTEGDFRILLILSGLFSGTIFLYNNFKIWKNSPISVKKWAFINLIGSFVFSYLILVFFALEITKQVPGISEITAGTGVFISSFAIFKSQRLIYVLPFKAIKLSVIQGDSGLTIYTYNWDESMKNVHEDMYSSIFESIRGFSSEILKVGKLTEINLDDGKLLIDYGDSNNYYFTLFSRKSSKTLVDGLKKFAQEFCEIYSEILGTDIMLSSEEIPTEIADELVQEIFSFIP